MSSCFESQFRNIDQCVVLMPISLVTSSTEERSMELSTLGVFHCAVHENNAMTIGIGLEHKNVMTSICEWKILNLASITE